MGAILKPSRLLFNIFTTVVLLSALYSVSETKKKFLIGLALWLPATAGVWLGFLAPEASILASAPTLMTIFLIYTAYRILRHVIRSQEVTSEVIYGALCVYLLLGLIWGMLYFGLETLQPGSFQGIAEASGFSEGLGSRCIYYSYVTLTTLGYGDVTPVSAGARSLSTGEALMGQLYLAVLIARLVGTHVAHSLKK